MMTIKFKYEVGQETARAFLHSVMGEYNAFASLVSFQGRVMMPNAITPRFLEDFKTKHKDIIVNARCTALGRILANKRRDVANAV
jgi:hypothetical protein